jgi:23S rRNA G2445 N2-methylase RlmL
MAQAYRHIGVDGVDLDPDAIGAARENAERAGMADGVRFFVADAADLSGAGPYDPTWGRVIRSLVNPALILLLYTYAPRTWRQS